MDRDTNIPQWEIAAYLERPVIERTAKEMKIPIQENHDAVIEKY